MLLTKANILKKAERLTKEEESSFFGGSLLLRELSRPDYLTCGEAGKVNNELWWASVFASGVIDPATNEPMFDIGEVIAFKADVHVWNEIIRIVALILNLSEVGAESLTKSGSSADPGRRKRSRGRQRDQRSAEAGA